MCLALRRRPAVCVGAPAVAAWLLFAFYYLSHQDAAMPSLESRTADLSSRLAAVEKSVAEQRREHRRLLDILKDTSARRAAAGGAGAGHMTLPPPLVDDRIAILVFACNRSKAIRNHLEQLTRLRPSKERFPIIVSQDCESEETTETIQSFGPDVRLLHHPDQREIELPKKSKKFLGYYKIARHYKWALNETFFNMGYDTVIITEDDLDISVDFFEYFAATYSLLRLDASLMCVSAWNDNGKRTLVEYNATLLWRTDFFPGLGWMLTRSLWEELSAKWPDAFWDDWLRAPEQRRGRSCVRPEVPRTAMSPFGKVGVSRGLFFDKHLKHIAINDQFVPFTKMDLSYLLREKYDPAFEADIYRWPSVTQSELRANRLSGDRPLPPAVRLTYEEKNTYKTTAKAFGLMDDFRAGVPRMAYRGVVAFYYENRTRVYLAPPQGWTAYDKSWS